MPGTLDSVTGVVSRLVQVWLVWAGRCVCVCVCACVHAHTERACIYVPFLTIFIAVCTDCSCYQCLVCALTYSQRRPLWMWCAVCARQPTTGRHTSAPPASYPWTPPSDRPMWTAAADGRWAVCVSLGEGAAIGGEWHYRWSVSTPSGDGPT